MLSHSLSKSNNPKLETFMIRCGREAMGVRGIVDSGIEGLR